MSEEKMLEMINATADIMFMAILRGRVSLEACKKDQSRARLAPDDRHF